MTLRDELDLINKYNELVGQDKVSPIQCRICEAVMLHHVSSTNRVYYRCTNCEFAMVPGIAFFNSLKEDIRYANAKHSS